MRSPSASRETFVSSARGESGEQNRVTEWIGLMGALSALAGTAIGGLITYGVARQQHLHERRRDNHRRLIEACEAIHELLSEVSQQASILSIGILGDIGTGLSLKGDILKNNVKLDRLKMLVDFYAPSLRPEVAAISNNFDALGRAAGETLSRSDRDDDWKTMTVESAMVASKEIETLSQMAKTKLASLIQPLPS